MIITDPGSTPLSSFKIVALEEVDSCTSYGAGNDCGTSSQHNYIFFCTRLIMNVGLSTR